jgi:hypothetical protein
VDVFFLFVLSTMLIYGDFVDDPIHAGWLGRQHLQEQECERISQSEAHTRYPASVPPTNARSAALFQIDALVCRHRVVENGARDARDEVILQRLQDDVGELSGLAAASSDEQTRFVVDAHYPNPEIVRKIAGASRIALAERGRRVSDRPPHLTAGDVEVLRTMPMRDAIPIACRSLHRSGALLPQKKDAPKESAATESPADAAENDLAIRDAVDDDVALLSIALLHPHESQLHAGLCHRGQFRWLR